MTRPAARPGPYDAATIAGMKHTVSSLQRFSPSPFWKPWRDGERMQRVF